MIMPTCMEILRGRRDMFLQESDWTQFNDSPLSKAKKTEWATYRQELRDLPSNNPNPKWEKNADGVEDNTLLPDITWPTKPE
tara:strand:+ start:263 stop:508 length:246 start_codon:yes stop_codon:yes gene_type:complete